MSSTGVEKSLPNGIVLTAGNASLLDYSIQQRNSIKMILLFRSFATRFGIRQLHRLDVHELHDPEVAELPAVT